MMDMCACTAKQGHPKSKPWVHQTSVRLRRRILQHMRHFPTPAWLESVAQERRETTTLNQESPLIKNPAQSVPARGSDPKSSLQNAQETFEKPELCAAAFLYTSPPTPSGLTSCSPAGVSIHPTVEIPRVAVGNCASGRCCR